MFLAQTIGNAILLGGSLGLVCGLIWFVFLEDRVVAFIKKKIKRRNKTEEKDEN